MGWIWWAPAFSAPVYLFPNLVLARTLDKGISAFKRFAKKGEISGEDAFVLGSSFGFPIDLTVLMAEEQGLVVDEAAYEEKMATFRDQSKASKGGAHMHIRGQGSGSCCRGLP